MRLNIAIPEAHVSKPVLDAALEAVTRLNEKMIEGGSPTATQLIEQGAKWRPEPPGQEHFDHAGIVAQRGWGDCDDWAPLRAAEHRAKGTDPGAKAVVMRSGPHLWHAVVQRSDGRIEDVSKEAGMPSGGVQALHGAAIPLMNAPSGSSVSGVYVVRPSLAIRPTPGGIQARVDLPWHWRESLKDKPTPTDYAMAALHQAPTAPVALHGAIVGAVELANASNIADPEHVQRLCCIAEACEGVPHAQLVDRWGPEHAQAAGQIVGSFFGNIFKAATSPFTSAAHFVTHPSLSNLTHMFTDPLQAAAHVAQPLAQAAAPFASFIPGVGPVAQQMLSQFGQHGLPQSFGDLGQYAAHLIPGMGGGAPMPAPMPMQMPMMNPYAMPQAWPTAFR